VWLRTSLTIIVQPGRQGEVTSLSNRCGLSLRGCSLVSTEYPGTAQTFEDRVMGKRSSNPISCVPDSMSISTKPTEDCTTGIEMRLGGPVRDAPFTSRIKDENEINICPRASTRVGTELISYHAHILHSFLCTKVLTTHSPLPDFGSSPPLRHWLTGVFSSQHCHPLNCIT
jgi:hypothetical protein